MYGIPKDLNLSFFSEKTLLQLCFGMNDIIFNFTDNVSITVTSLIGYVVADGKIKKCEDFRNAADFLLKLLHESIISAQKIDEGTLCLVFRDNKKIYIYDDSKQFESYIIKNGNSIIVV